MDPVVICSGAQVAEFQRQIGLLDIEGLAVDLVLCVLILPLLSIGIGYSDLDRIDLLAGFDPALDTIRVSHTDSSRSVIAGQPYLAAGRVNIGE